MIASKTLSPMNQMNHQPLLFQDHQQQLIILLSDQHLLRSDITMNEMIDLLIDIRKSSMIHENHMEENHKIVSMKNDSLFQYSDNKLFNRMKEMGIHTYITSSCIKLDNGNQQILREDFIQVLCHIPRLHLNEQDALAVLANIPSTMIINSESDILLSNDFRRGSMTLSPIRESSPVKSPSNNHNDFSSIRMNRAIPSKNINSAHIDATAAAVAATKTLFSENTFIKWKEFLISCDDILRIVFHDRYMKRSFTYVKINIFVCGDAI
jgi:hypothetical protein